MGAYEDDGVFVAHGREATARGRGRRRDAGLGRVPRRAAAGREPRRRGAGRAPEVGVLAVQRTAAAASDPVFSLLPDEFRALQWHGDTFTLPPGAVQLARSDAYEQQAFVVDGAYGIQFHIEVGADLADEWAAVPAYAASLEATWAPARCPAWSRSRRARAADDDAGAGAVRGVARPGGWGGLASLGVRGAVAARPDGDRVTLRAVSGRRPTSCGQTDRGSRLDDGFPTESGDRRPVTQRSRRRRAHARRTRRGHRRTARSGRS